MFHRKKKKYLEDYKSTVINMFEICNILIDSLDMLAGINMGDLSHVSGIMGQLKSLDTFITSYMINYYSSPSTNIALSTKFTPLREKYREIIRLEMKISEYDLRIKKCSFDLTINPGLAYDIQPVKSNLELHLADSVGCAKVHIDQLKFMIREFQNAFISEYTIVNSGLDIVSQRKKVKQLKKDGISYSIDFKVTSKNELLNINKSKEVPSNETNRGKSSGKL